MLRKANTKGIDVEVLRSAASPSYFIMNNVQILCDTTRRYTPFQLWPFQIELVDTFHKNKKVICLKARQLGFSLVAAAYCLWDVTFNPISNCLIVSKDDSAAILFVTRLKEMWRRLPDKFRLSVGEKDSAHIFSLSNGSTVKSFSSDSNSIRGETATIVVVDEAEFNPDFSSLMISVEPTVSAGSNKIFLISTVDKSAPISGFKNIFRGALNKDNDYVPVFIPWNSRPDRDMTWFSRELNSKTSLLGSRQGGYDAMHQEFPGTVFEALSPNSLDKRLAGEWLQKCYIGMEPMEQLPRDAPSITGLSIYHLPVTDPNQDPVHYCIGVDCAGGGPAANDSAFSVLRRDTGEEVAVVCGKIEPTVFAGYIDQVGRYYNNAQVMVENAFHGQHVIPWLREHSPLTLLKGHDKKYGWTSSVKGKTILYDICADAFRNEEVMIHTYKTIDQLSTIEGNTGKAPEPLLDDLADSVALALAGIIASLGRSFTEDTTPDIQITMKVPKEITEAEYNFRNEDDEIPSFSQMVETMVF